jgi:hypothetical protein
MLFEWLKEAVAQPQMVSRPSMYNLYPDWAHDRAIPIIVQS